MTDRELLTQALEALTGDLSNPEWDGLVASLRERLAQPEPWEQFYPDMGNPFQPQRTHWEGCEEVHPECRKSATKAHELSDKAWAAIWEEFAWESDGTTDKEFQEEMVKKHGKGHYYMDAEETWNRQKDLIQKLVNARLKEQNA